MNKWQIISPLVGLTITAFVLSSVIASTNRRAFVIAHSHQIGRDLIATADSSRLVEVDPGLRMRLTELLSEEGVTEDVIIGDEPNPIGNGKACSRIILSSSKGQAIGIRLGHIPESGRFQVLGHWTISSTIGRSSRTQEEGAPNQSVQ